MRTVRRCLTGIASAAGVLLTVSAGWAQEPPSEPTPAPAPPTAPEQPASAPDAPPPKFKFSDLHLGVDGQLYFPSSGKARNRFGDVWTSINPGLGLVEMIAPRTALRFSIEVINNRRRGNNRILMIPVGAAIRRGYGKSERFRPYYGANLALLPYSMRVDDENIGPGFQVGASLAPLIGIGFRRRVYIEAEYVLTTRLRGYDLSGLNLSAGLRF